MGSAAVGASIRITVGEATVTGTLWDNATTESLAALLPLTVAFADVNGVEKAGRLPRALSMEGMPEGDDPEPMDIGYYVPGHYLVLYYGDVGYWKGIARIGRLEGDISAISDQVEDFTGTVELAD